MAIFSQAYIITKRISRMNFYHDKSNITIDTNL